MGHTLSLGTSYRMSVFVVLREEKTYGGKTSIRPASHYDSLVTLGILAQTHTVQ